MLSYFIRLLFGFCVATSVPSWCGTRWVFEPNVGQTATEVRFLGRAGGSTAYATPSEVALSLRGGQDVLRLRFPGAESRPVLEGADPLPGKTNYLTGAARRTGIPQFGRVRYRGLYRGIDLVLYGGEEGLEYDFEVAPGADPQAIALNFEGADSLALDSQGDLLISTEGREIRQRKPVAWQGQGTARREVGCDYMLGGAREVRLNLGPYDASERLVIDPAVTFSTQLGSSSVDRTGAVATDAEGNVYVLGSAYSTDFQTTPGAFSRTRKGERCDFDVTMFNFCTDVFVAKFNRQGDLLYSTYIGGTQVDYGDGIAVDAAGNAYVTGTTKSNDLPVTPGAFQRTFRGGYCVYDPPTGPPVSYPCNDAFVLKLNPSGSALLYSTYLGGGGTDAGRAVFVDQAGNATVVGNSDSTDFPAPVGTPPRAASTGVFLTQLSSTGAALFYSIFLGPGNVRGAAADPLGNIYLTGLTSAPDFPYTAGAYLGPSRGSDIYAAEQFAAKVSPAGAVLYAARIESGRSTGTPAIAVDSKGQALVTGAAAQDIVISTLDAQGAALVNTLTVGGRAIDYAHGIVLDRAGNAYVVGTSGSSDFPATPGAARSCGGLVLVKVGASSQKVEYSGFLTISSATAIAADPEGNVWLAGDKAFVARVDSSKEMGGTVTCLASAASIKEGPVSPGELVAIFGGGLGPVTPAGLTLDSTGKVSTELAGVRVLFDGIPAPLTYVQANQINAVVPFGVSGRTSTQVEVEYQGKRTAPVTATVAEATPGTFTLDSSGSGQGVILNQDGTINGPDNPAPEGTIIAVWATGAGLFDQSVADGQVIGAPYPKPKLPVRLQLNSMDQEVLYAGAAPGLVAGVLQVNARIAPGTKRPWGVVTLIVGGKYDTSVAEISIK